MGALSNPILATGGSGDEIRRDCGAATTVYGNSLGAQDNGGLIYPNATSGGGSGPFAGIFSQFSQYMQFNQNFTNPNRAIRQNPKGTFLCRNLTGVAKSNLGQPIFCGTDNPDDCSLTYTANAKFVGILVSLVDDPTQINGGYVANQGLCLFDVFSFDGCGLSATLNTYQSTIFMRSGQTAYASLYQCPANRRAVVLSAQITAQGANANYATSATFDFSQVASTTRTSLLSGTVNVNTGGSLTADTPFALTGAATPFATLSKGDRLEGKVVTVGAETTMGSLLVQALVLEYAYSN